MATPPEFGGTVGRRKAFKKKTKFFDFRRGRLPTTRVIQKNVFFFKAVFWVARGVVYYSSEKIGKRGFFFSGEGIPPRRSAHPYFQIRGRGKSEAFPLRVYRSSRPPRPLCIVAPISKGGGLGNHGLPPSQVACVLPRIKGKASRKS